jgi:uncharacterized Ntn-hydrolase superfamily protein
VQSHFFGTGAVVPWVEAGVGAVATQAMAEVAHGPDSLARLRAGRSPAETLDDVLAPDAHAATRQLGIVDAQGRSACHTGGECIVHAGHVTGEGFSVQANMMTSQGVPEAMAAAFTTTVGALAGRLLAALDAAEAAGGDIRGQQSAALLVVDGTPADRPGHDLLIDVRVEDDPRPLVELRRLVGLATSYRRMEEAEVAMAGGDLDVALAIYEDAASAHPDQPEFTFWLAIMLAGLGRTDEAAATAARVFARSDGERWRELVRRLPDAGLLDPDAVARLADR